MKSNNNEIQNEHEEEFQKNDLEPLDEMICRWCEKTLKEISYQNLPHKLKSDFQIQKMGYMKCKHCINCNTYTITIDVQ